MPSAALARELDNIQSMKTELDRIQKALDDLLKKLKQEGKSPEFVKYKGCFRYRKQFSELVEVVVSKYVCVCVVELDGIVAARRQAYH